jgi:SAM-dependent methyltransferase
MAPWLADLLRCPDCGGRLTDARAGSLICSGCARAFPVVGGIPRFVPADNYATSFGFQWNRFRRTQLDSCTGVPISRDRFLRETGWSETVLQGKLVLDVGCGAGRFAEIAAGLGARVVALDYSSAVDACRANLPTPNVQVVQGDVYALPVAAEAFDFVYSLGVIQHTPDVERTVKALVRPLKPGGTLVVDVYRKHWKGWLHPRVWLRPVTTRLDGARLFRIVERMAPPLLRLSNLVDALPVVGPQVRRLIPVANYRGQLPLSDAALEEWAVLDTFDWLSPAYDQPQTAATLRQWFDESALTGVEVFASDHLTARGRKAALRPDAHRD